MIGQPPSSNAPWPCAACGGYVREAVYLQVPVPEERWDYAEQKAAVLVCSRDCAQAYWAARGAAPVER